MSVLFRSFLLKMVTSLTETFNKMINSTSCLTKHAAISKGKFSLSEIIQSIILKN